MRTITLKLTKRQQKILQQQLWVNICGGSCFMKDQTRHFPKHDCINCPKNRDLADISHQLETQLEK